MAWINVSRPRNEPPQPPRTTRRTKIRENMHDKALNKVRVILLDYNLVDLKGVKPQWWPEGLVFCDKFKILQHKTNRSFLIMIINHHKHKVILRNRKRYKKQHENEENINTMNGVTFNNHKVPIVSLTDCFVTKLIAYNNSKPNKATFMGLLDLQPKTINLASFNRNNSSLYCNGSSSSKIINCPNIPFSSNVGRIMLEREKGGLTNNLKLKRIDKTEWYLNTNVSLSSLLKAKKFDYEITYKSKKACRDRYYKFPLKRYMKSPGKYYDLLKLMKPCSVRLKKLNLDEYFRKKKCKVLLRPLTSDTLKILESSKRLRVLLPKVTV